MAPTFVELPVDSGVGDEVWEAAVDDAPVVADLVVDEEVEEVVVASEEEEEATVRPAAKLG